MHLLTASFAAIEALKNCDMEVNKMVEAYDQRRRYLMHAFKEMGLDCFEPFGAFYVFPSIKKFGLSSEEFCKQTTQGAEAGCCSWNSIW